LDGWICGREKEVLRKCGKKGFECSLFGRKSVPAETKIGIYGVQAGAPKDYGIRLISLQMSCDLNI